MKTAVSVLLNPWKGGVWNGTSLFSVTLAYTNRLISNIDYSILSLLKSSKIHVLIVKVVKNDIFKVGSERVNAP